MGDDELNFTDEEARCWADDPHNQAHDDSVSLRLVITIFLLAVLAVIVLAFFPGSRGSSSVAGHSYSRLSPARSGKIYLPSAWGAGSAQSVDGCQAAVVVSVAACAVSMMQQEEETVMPTEEVSVIEEDLPETPVVPEVEILGDDAVIRIEKREGVEERKVRLPKATWG